MISFAAVAWTVIPVALSAQSPDAPLSAIDWLSQSVSTPVVAAQPAKPPKITEPPIADSANAPSITVTTLDAPSPDPVGLLGSDVTGLDRNLWAGSDETALIALLGATPNDNIPAMQEFLRILLLAEADPPLGATAEGGLFLARIDKLLDLGDIEPALEMLTQADPDSPALFRRWFDLALLTGTEDHACDMMQSRPQVAPTYPARIFCLARSGDWNTAALTLNTHRVLGDVDAEEEALLTRFLDPESFEGEADLPAPSRISPLVFRMREAIGEAMATANLPLAFAHADLRTTTGWKAQIEASERLARRGAISENVLQSVYTARTAAASGGVWDRAEAIQRFEVALNARDPNAISTTLPAAWESAITARVEVPFARLYGAALQNLPLSDAASELAFTIGLLSPDYELVANAAPQGDPVLIGVARGNLDAGLSANGPAAAVIAGFSGATPPDALTTLVANGKLGEALLLSVAAFDDGIAGDLTALGGAIAFWRSVGLEDVARRAGLQVLLLDRNT